MSGQPNLSWVVYVGYITDFLGVYFILERLRQVWEGIGIFDGNIYIINEFTIL